MTRETLILEYSFYVFLALCRFLVTSIFLFKHYYLVTPMLSSNIESFIGYFVLKLVPHLAQLR